MPSRLFILRPPVPPQSDDPLEHRRYHKDTANWHFKAAMVIAVMILASVWALTPAGFARAGDVDKKLKVVTDEVAQIKTLQARDSARLAKALSNTIAAELRYLQAKRCKETTIERERLWTEMERKQEEYQELRSFRYEIPSCGDI